MENLLNVIEAHGLTPVRKGASYTTAEHDSLTIFKSDFYWAAIGKGSKSLKTAEAKENYLKKLLRQAGHSEGNYTVRKYQFEDFTPNKQTNRTKKERLEFAASRNLGIETTNFHYFTQKIGISKKHLRTWLVGGYEFKRKSSEDNVLGMVLYTSFFYKSVENELLSSKSVDYLPIGKRNKNTQTLWLKNEQGCYGEHLFDPTKKTFIVESEKTAIILAYFFGNFNFLATGGVGGLTNFKASRSRINKKFGRYDDYTILCDLDEKGLLILSEPIYKNYEFYVPKNGIIKDDLADVIIRMIEAKEVIPSEIYDNLVQVKSNKIATPERYLTDSALFTASFLNFLRIRRKTLLAVETGRGKTTWVLSNLEKIKPKNGRVFFFAPRLTNTKDITQRAINASITQKWTTCVVSSDLGEYTNLEGANTDANFIISTYASFDKTAKEFDITENDLLIFDEFHAITEKHSPVLDHWLRVGNILAITATPNLGLCKVYDIELFTVESIAKKGIFQVYGFEMEAQILTYLQAKTGKILIQTDSIAQQELFAKKLDNSRIINAENKSEWEYEVIKKKTFGNYQFVFCTSVIAAGIDVNDADFEEVVFIQSKTSEVGSMIHTPSSMVQFAARLRRSELNIVLFRNQKDRPKNTIFETEFKKIYAAAELVAAKLNTGNKSYLNFDEGQYLFSPFKFVHFCVKRQKYVPNALKIAQKIEGIIGANTSNESISKEMEDKGFAKSSIITSIEVGDLVQNHLFLKDERAKINEKKQAEKEAGFAQLETAVLNDSILYSDFKAENKQIANRYELILSNLEAIHEAEQEAFDGLIVREDSKEKARRMVLDNQGDAAYGRILTETTIQKLHKAKKERLTAKELIQREIVINFLDCIRKTENREPLKRKEFKRWANTILRHSIANVLDAKSKATLPQFEGIGMEIIEATIGINVETRKERRKEKSRINIRNINYYSLK